MGFLERIIGKDMITRYESIESGSAREASEEAGASVVIKIENPEYPYLNPAPSFVATWSNLVFIEVKLEMIEELKKDRNEPIYSAEYITVDELRRRVAKGKHDKAVYRYGNALALWFIFFCSKPDLWK